MAKLTYTDKLADEICGRLMEGESLRSICRDESMPGLQTLFDWLCDERAQFDRFRSRYARAREVQADVMDARIMELADNSTPETANSDRVKLSALQWRASKLAPKKYGDKLNVDAKQSGEVTVKVVTGVPRARAGTNAGTD